MRLVGLILFLSFSEAQDLQVKYVSAYTIDFDWGGEVESVAEVTAARGYLRFNGKLNPKRWIFRFFGGERGFIVITGTDNSIGYNAKRERYWLLPYGSMNMFADMSFGNPSKEKTEETSTTQEPDEKETSKREDQNDFGNIIKEIFKDDTSTIQIDRFLSDGTEIINGFRTNKWTTIISTKNNKLVIDEWVVDQLLLKDSLYSYLLPMITDDDFEDFTIEKVSSRDFIRQVDSTYSLQASNESIVLAKLLVDSDNSWIQSASFEIRELYAVPFDASSFAIPEEYERIQIDEDSDEDAQEKEID